MEQEEKHLSRTLPPMVEGKLNGTLIMKISDIVWCRKPPKQVAIFVKWWGEKDETVFRPFAEDSSCDLKSSSMVVTYKIRTSAKIFQSYLKGCEMLTLNVTDESVNLSVGTVTIKDLSFIFNETQHEQYYPIINSFDNKVGDLLVSFSLLFISQSSLPDLLECKTPQECIIPAKSSGLLGTNSQISFKTNEIYQLKKQNKNMPSSKVDVKDPHLKTFKKQDTALSLLLEESHKLKDAMINAVFEDGVDIVDNKCLQSTNNDINPHEQKSCLNTSDGHFKFLDFLSGKDMNREEEKAIMQKIKDTSLIDSLLNIMDSEVNKKNDTAEELTEENTNSVPMVTSESIIARSSFAGNSRLMFSINCIKISIYSLILNENNKRKGPAISTTYFIEFVFPWDTFEQSSKVKRMWTKKKINNVVYFNKYCILELPSLEDQSLENMVLTFRISSRPLHEKNPTLLGTAMFSMTSLYSNECFSFNNNLTVLTGGKISHETGMLKMKLQLGYNNTVFGQDLFGFFEDITNKTSCHNDAKTKKMLLDVQDDISTVEKQPDKSHCINSVKQNLPYDQEICSVSPSQVQAVAKPVLLHALLYIPEGQLLETMSSYLVCRSFWKDDIIRSEICWDTDRPQFSFHKLLPVLLNRDLLERSRDNYLVTELWQCKSMQQDTLIGLCKLPLQVFYIAYKDQLVASQVILAKYPVISMDNWTDVLNPFTRLPVGKLKVILALGTEDQIQLLEMSRGMTEDICHPSESCLPSKSIVNKRIIRGLSQSAANFNSVMSHTSPSERENIYDSELQEACDILNNASGFKNQDIHLRYEEMFSNDSEQDVISNRVSKSVSHHKVQDNFTSVDHVNVVHCSVQTDPIQYKSVSSSDDDTDLQQPVKENVQYQGSVKDSKCLQCARKDNHITLQRCVKTSKNNCENICKCSYNSNVPGICHGAILCNDFQCCCAKFTSFPAYAGCNCRSGNMQASGENYIISGIFQENEIGHKVQMPNNYTEEQVKHGDSTIHKENTELSVEHTQSHRDKLVNNAELQQSPLLSVISKDIDASFKRTNKILHNETGHTTSDVAANNIIIQNRAKNITNSEVLSESYSYMKEPNKTNFMHNERIDTPQNISHTAKQYIHTRVEIENIVHLIIDKNLVSEQSKMYITLQVDGFESDNKKLFVTQLVTYKEDTDWNWNSDVWFPTYYLVEENKRVILKLWHTVSDAPDQIMDSVVGFIAVDLSILLYGFPVISGWFHIMDFTNTIKGQIKIKIIPLERLERFMNRSISNTMTDAEQNLIVNSSASKLSNTSYDKTKEQLISSRNAVRQKLKELDQLKQKIQDQLGSNSRKFYNSSHVLHSSSFVAHSSSSIDNSSNSYLYNTDRGEKPVIEPHTRSEKKFGNRTLPNSTNIMNNSVTGSDRNQTTDVQICNLRKEMCDTYLNSHSDPVIESAVREMDWDSVFNPLLFQPLLSSTDNLHFTGASIDTHTRSLTQLDNAEIISRHVSNAVNLETDLSHVIHRSLNENSGTLRNIYSNFESVAGMKHNTNLNAHHENSSATVGRSLCLLPSDRQAEVLPFCDKSVKNFYLTDGNQQGDSDSVVSRQAPDGGNPGEGSSVLGYSLTKQNDAASSDVQSVQDSSESDDVSEVMNWKEVERIAKILSMKLN